MKQNKASIALVVCMAMGVAGCASTPSNGLTEEERHVQRISALADIEQYRNEIQPQLKDKELGWFATEKFNQAKSLWNEAEQQYRLVAESPNRLNERLGVFNSTTRSEAISQALAGAIEALNRANVIRAEAQVVLADAFANDNVLQNLEANDRFASDYQETQNNLKTLIDFIAQDRKNSAIEGLPGLLRNQHKLEVKTVRAIHLTEPRQRLDGLEQEFIHQYAPQTFNTAKVTYEQAHAFIAEQPRNEAGIIKHVEATRFATEHARHIGKDVHFLHAHELEDYERYLLNFESQLNRIRQSLDMEDLRDQRIADQGSLIHQHILSLQEETPEIVVLREELTEASAELATVLTELEALKSELAREQEKSSGIVSLVAALQVERDELAESLAHAEEAIDQLEMAALQETDSNEIEMMPMEETEEAASEEMVEVQEQIAEETPVEVIETQEAPVQVTEETMTEETEVSETMESTVVEEATEITDSKEPAQSVEEAVSKAENV